MFKLKFSEKWLKEAAEAEEGCDVECGVRNPDGTIPALNAMIAEMKTREAIEAKADLVADKHKPSKSGDGCCWFNPCRCFKKATE